MTLDDWVRLHNRFMVAFDLALGSGTLLAPDQTLKALGHAAPTDDARELFRRNGPLWLTFAAAHAVAARRDRREDWHALAWLRGAEIATDVLWSRSPAFRDTRGRAGLWFAGASNLAMAVVFRRLARR